MKAKDHVVFEEGKRNFYQPLNAGDQTTPQESSIDACLQNEGLSSKEKDFEQTGETFSSQLHCNNPDDILVQIRYDPTALEIPDEMLLRVIEIAEKAGHLDIPGEMGRNGIE